MELIGAPSEVQTGVFVGIIVLDSLVHLTYSYTVQKRTYF